MYLASKEEIKIITPKDNVLESSNSVKHRSKSFLTSPRKAYTRTSSIMHTVALNVIYSAIVPGTKQARNKENIAAF